MSDSLEPAGGAMRASDADRDRVGDELRAHCLEGRITMDELDTRLEGVMASRTIRELAEFVYDLPTVPAPAQRRGVEPRPRIGPPGSLPFTRRLVVPASLRRTHDVALDTIAPALNRHGYALVSQAPSELTFERARGSGGRVLAAVLLFPFGLLALLMRRRRERIVISFEARGAAKTNLTVHGVAPRRVRKEFAQLNFS